ncbi:MAG: hypothetical protein WCT77_13475 [Bacteroidota bacterium]
MKRNLFLLFILILVSGTSLFSQVQQPKVPSLKPVWYVEDLYFIYQALDNIEIQGSEVEPFLDVKKNIQTALQLSQTQKKQLSETIQTEVPFQTAQNLVNFLGRAKFAGKNAEQYKRFIDAIIEASKALQPQK